jgi:hypothetical protein
MNQNYTSEVKEELKMLAPVLSGLPKANIDKLPEGYFEDVEEKIMSQILLTNYELTKSVPSGYLEKVEDDILSKVISVHTVKENRIVGILKYKKLIASIAAMMLFVLATWFVFNRVEETSGEIVINAEEHDTYLEYIHKNIGDYDINMLVDKGLIAEEDLVMESSVFEQFDAEDTTTWMESDINF